MKKLILLGLIILTFMTANVNAAIKKDRTVYGQVFNHHVLIKALYDRTNNTVTAYYALYASREHYVANKHDEVKIVSVKIPFSAIPLENLLNVKTITEQATMRSIKNQDDIETNWWNTAEVVTDQ